MWTWIIMVVILIVGLNMFFKSKKLKSNLSEDVTKAYEWISEALKSSNYDADFSFDSLKEVERFFEENCEDGNAKSGGLLSENLGQRLFSIGCYVGEVIRRHYDGEWITNDNDPWGEINIGIKLSDWSIVWPVQKVMKRFKNGKEDSIYVYGIALKPENK